MLNIKSCIAATFALVLIGCGFHLRGNINWPQQYKTVYLSSFAQKIDRNSLLGVLQKQLPMSIKVVEAQKDADLTIQLLSETIQMRAISGSEYGQNKEETYYYNASVQVVDRAGNFILPATTLTKQKDFSYSESDLLGKSTGEQELRKELISETALMLMRRLTATLSKLESNTQAQAPGSP